MSCAILFLSHNLIKLSNYNTASKLGSQYWRPNAIRMAERGGRVGVVQSKL